MSILNIMLGMLLMCWVLLLHQLKVPFISRGGILKIILIVLSVMLVSAGVIRLTSPTISSKTIYGKEHKPAFKSNAFKLNKIK